MNRRLLTTVVCAALMVTGWTVLAFTCEEKATTARAATAKASATCGAKAVTADHAQSCAGKTAAQMAEACAGKTTAQMADACAGKSAKAEMAHGCCAAKTAKTTTAAAGVCKIGGAAMAGASRIDAVVAGGPGCSSHSAKTADRADHADHVCDACADMADCDAEIRAAGGVTQAVKLKNGVMFIHTATGASHVRAIQAALTRRSDRLAAISAAGDKARLCPGCREMRGAMASGKLNREMVTIEGGTLTLMTSNDRSIVAKLHAMAGENLARKS